MRIRDGHRTAQLGVAKDQRLSLNPSQISGACGRLMCSLRYEHAFYVQARKRFPKEGKILRSAVGEEKVVANDIFRERVALRNVEGDVRTIPLAARRGNPIILMHMQGAPQTMQANPHYADVVSEVEQYLRDRAAIAMEARVRAGTRAIRPRTHMVLGVEIDERIVGEAARLAAVRAEVLEEAETLPD